MIENKRLFDGFLLCSDIDGTLLDSKSKIPLKNKLAINYFIRHGGHFTVSSGRWPDFIKNYDIEINAPVIGLNGTLVYDWKEKCALRRVFLSEKYMEVVRYAERYSYTEVQVCFEENVYIARSCEEPIEKLNTHLRAHKALYVFQDEKTAITFMQDCNEKFADQYIFHRSWSRAVEQIPLCGDKGEAVFFLKTRMNVAKLVTIGDYENDISMLQNADIGFAPENALQSVKEKAMYVVADNNHGSIYEVIKKLYFSITEREEA